MISAHIMVSLPVPDQERVKAALAELAATGILMMQYQENARRIVENFSEEEEEALTKRIVEVRKENKLLRGLHDLGISYMKRNS